MPRRTLPTTGISEDFQLTEKTIARLERDYPTVHIERTKDRFERKAKANGWMYRDWQAAFLNYCDNAQKYGGVEFKRGRDQDPLWIPVLNEARSYGFRVPEWQETPDSYRTSLKLWMSKKELGKKAPVVEFGSVLKGFAK